MRNRNDESQMTAEELFILNAIRAVESIPAADTRLTNAVCKLAEAKHHLGNYIDGIAEEEPKGPSKEETFLDRLLNEARELAEKTNKLNDFMRTQAFINLDRPNKDLLYKQSRLMNEYLQVLGQRIEILGSKFSF